MVLQEAVSTGSRFQASLTGMHPRYKDLYSEALLPSDLSGWSRKQDQGHQESQPTLPRSPVFLHQVHLVTRLLIAGLSDPCPSLPHEEDEGRTKESCLNECFTRPGPQGKADFPASSSHLHPSLQGLQASVQCSQSQLMGGSRKESS